MNFDPKFTVVESFKEAATFINLPHEDYPKRVDKTEKVIKDLVYTLGDEVNPKVDESLVKQIHSYVMDDMHHSCRGTWRPMNVTVSGNKTVDSILVKEEMEKILPYDFNSEITEWYQQFQIIHPFADGNGRVGGIILSVVSYINSFGRMILAPLQQGCEYILKLLQQ